MLEAAWPAVSVNLERGVISIECTIAAEDEGDVDRTVSHLNELALAAFAAAEYEQSTTSREAVPA